MELRKIAFLLVAATAIGGCRLTVDVSGEGTVTSDDGNIDCTDSCSTRVKRSKEVFLLATPAANSFFAYWEGCDDVVDDDECFVYAISGTKRKVKAYFVEDVALSEADISKDVLQCALDSDYEETNTLKEITKLECSGDDEEYSGDFDPEGIDSLQNLTSVVIRGGGLEDATAFGKLTKLTTLELSDQALTDVTPLLNLNVNTLLELILNDNKDIDCSDVEELVDQFPGSSVGSDSCNL